MADKQYDVLVVGSGPGGEYAAVTAAKLGKRVGLIERKPYLGGVSLQTGTIPSKALREAAFLASRFAGQGMRESYYRRQVKGADFLAEAMRRKDAVVDRKEAALLSRLLEHGVSIIPGEASFADAHTLEVRGAGDQIDRVCAQVIVLATGSRPRRPPDVPFDKERVLDSTSLLKIRRLPSSLAVVGGGVIACELATLFAPLGVEVTIVDHHEQLLAYLDRDVADNLAEHMRDMGIALSMQTRVTAIERRASGVRLTTEPDGQIEADCLLYALGRQPNYEGLAIEKAGLAADDNGWVRVNEHYQTPVPHIYIVGDLGGAPALATTAMEQGRLAASHAFGEQAPPSAAPLPMAIYTIPELSYVGETERQLIEQGVDFVVGRAAYADTARGRIIGDHRGMLKLLADRADGRLLGVHIIGEGASELVHIGQVLMGCGGGIDLLAGNVFNYPTLAECYKSAALECAEQLRR